ncbi:hypothetical protein FRC11_006322 [Ceratobasidium sp. 423]|nr:hypothetical protein FRC11_006322 [Ceratobasidium sp. 423]
MAMAHNDPSKQVEEFTSQLGDDPDDQTVWDGTPEIDGSMLYLMLGSPNPLWLEALEELLEGAHVHHLLNSADGNVTRCYCQKIPDMLNACIQTISQMTGATISAQAVWPGFDDSAVLCTYSTIMQHASDYILPVDAVEEIAYIIYQVCYGAVWQGIPSFMWTQVIKSHHKGLKIYFSPLHAPDNFPYDKPPEQWKTDEVDATYGHVLGCQTHYYSSDPDAEGHMF